MGSMAKVPIYFRYLEMKVTTGWLAELAASLSESWDTLPCHYPIPEGNLEDSALGSNHCETTAYVYANESNRVKSDPDFHRNCEKSHSQF